MCGASLKKKNKLVSSRTRVCTVLTCDVKSRWREGMAVPGTGASQNKHEPSDQSNHSPPMSSPARRECVRCGCVCVGRVSGLALTKLPLGVGPQRTHIGCAEDLVVAMHCHRFSHRMISVCSTVLGSFSIKHHSRATLLLSLSLPNFPAQPQNVLHTIPSPSTALSFPAFAWRAQEGTWSSRHPHGHRRSCCVSWILRHSFSLNHGHLRKAAMRP